MDRSPLHSDTDTDSETDQPELTGGESNTEDPSQTSLIGATANITNPELTTSVEPDPDQIGFHDSVTNKVPESNVEKELHGATSSISAKDLENLRRELVISDDELD